MIASVEDGMKARQDQTLLAFASTTAAVTESCASYFVVHSEPALTSEDSYMPLMMSFVGFEPAVSGR